MAALWARLWVKVPSNAIILGSFCKVVDHQVVTTNTVNCVRADTSALLTKQYKKFLLRDETKEGNVNVRVRRVYPKSNNEPTGTCGLIMRRKVQLSDRSYVLLIVLRGSWVVRGGQRLRKRHVGIRTRSWNVALSCGNASVRHSLLFTSIAPHTPYKDSVTQLIPST
ncbi:hypothetical protein BC830DRAFT_1085215 [Chytriomyces sp. MP71]|nr:hypothetical protein BC830DRAFT_1085215 [Chytriomyces sp. MP71]